MYPLNNVPTVREYPLDVLRVHRRREVRVAVVSAFSRCSTDLLERCYHIIQNRTVLGERKTRYNYYQKANGKVKADKVDFKNKKFFTYEKLVPQEKLSSDKHLVFLISPFH